MFAFPTIMVATGLNIREPLLSITTINYLMVSSMCMWVTIAPVAKAFWVRVPAWTAFYRTFNFSIKDHSKYQRTVPVVSLELTTPGLQTQCSSHWATGAQKLLLGRSWVYPVGVLHHYIFIISQLWLTSHPRSTVVLLDTITPGTSREIYSEDANGESRTPKDCFFFYFQIDK